MGSYQAVVTFLKFYLVPDVSAALFTLTIGVVTVYAVMEHGDTIEELSDKNNYKSFKIVHNAPGDFEPDGDVDGVGLETLAAEWLETENLSAEIYPGRVNGVVNLLDFAEFVNYWMATIEQ
jgi:hypothetical protein